MRCHWTCLTRWVMRLQYCGTYDLLGCVCWCVFVCVCRGSGQKTWGILINLVGYWWYQTAVRYESLGVAQEHTHANTPAHTHTDRAVEMSSCINKPSLKSETQTWPLTSICVSETLEGKFPEKEKLNVLSVGCLCGLLKETYCTKRGIKMENRLCLWAVIAVLLPLQVSDRG